jgi:SET domain-containing protein
MKKIMGKKSRIKGLGGFAGEAVKKGDRVRLLGGKKATDAQADKLCASGKIRYDDPLEIGEGKYFILSGVSLLINHSCNPNCGIRGERELVALRDIKKGEELSYDYSTVVGSDKPWEEPWMMLCLCGARNCRRRIGNWETLPKKRLAYYLEENVLPGFVLAQVRRQKRKK